MPLRHASRWLPPAAEALSLYTMRYAIRLRFAHAEKEDIAALTPMPATAPRRYAAERCELARVTMPRRDVV